MQNKSPTRQRFIHHVSGKVFKKAYDLTALLPGKFKWFAIDDDVGPIEKLMSMPAAPIGATLWVKWIAKGQLEI